MLLIYNEKTNPFFNLAMEEYFLKNFDEDIFILWRNESSVIVGKNQNTLTKENIQKILETYKNYKEVEKYSHIATMDEIKENEYNLNIKRYVDTFEEEEEIDIEETKKNIAKINEELQVLEKELQKSLKELGL